MKLEIKKETKPNGDMFFQVYQDDTHLKSFWIGNHITGEKGTYGTERVEEPALRDAQEYYEIIKLNAQSDPIVEIIKSEQI